MTTGVRSRGFVAAILAALLTLSAPTRAACPPAPAAGTQAVWITLPRADAVVAYPDWPAAPLANPRALDRRARRGDPRRRARLARGPEPAALVAASKMVSRVRTVSRWLSAVSVDATPAQVEEARRVFGGPAVRPVARFVRPRHPRSVDTWAGGPRKTHDLQSKQDLDYGPSLDQIQQIQVDALHRQGFSGKGVRILVLDTGFDPSHVALTHLAVIAQRDFVCQDDVTVNEPCDADAQHNHGTGVLGVLAGFAPGDLFGPAYAAEFLLAKTEDVRSETQVEEDNFVAGLEWGEALGADMSTASLGYHSFDDGFVYPPEAFDGDTAVTTVALDNLAALGVLPIVAAGNRGPDPSTLLTPADADSAVTIGSVDSLGTVSNFSSRGPTFDGRIKPDVAARGRLTTWVVAAGGFGRNNGTSLAAPLAAGAAALLLEGHPEWDVIQVRDALRTTATGPGAPDNQVGWGVVQAEAAMYSTPPLTPLPFLPLEPADGSTGVGTGATFRWGTAVDLQTPAAVDYTVHASSHPDFSDTVGLWFAVHDTTRVIDPLPPGPFYWRVLARDPDGNVRTSCAWVFTPGDPTGTTVPSPPTWASLSAPRPNPFNPRVTLVLHTDRPADATADIFDVSGRRVRSLRIGQIPVGDRILSWDGTDAARRPVASGVYLLRARLRSAGATPLEVMRRMVLVR